MNKIWDVENEKFINVEKKTLDIKRRLSDEFISSCEMPLKETSKIQEVMDKMTILWNNSMSYEGQQVIVNDTCRVKLSVYLDDDKKEYLMKFRVISRNKEGKKNIDYIKLNRNKSRILYANLYNSLNQ